MNSASSCFTLDIDAVYTRSNNNVANLIMLLISLQGCFTNHHHQDLSKLIWKIMIKIPDKHCDTAAMLSEIKNVRMYILYHWWNNDKPNQHEIN